jgi:hypothetical protein
MRKEKLSYLVLVVEIVAIVYLHSVKKSTDIKLTPGHIVQDPIPELDKSASSPYLIHQVKKTADTRIAF